MSLSLRDCTFYGPALPEPFVKFELERHLKKLSPLPSARGEAGRGLQDRWDTLRRKLRRLGETGGDVRVFNHVIEPLAPLLGYPRVEPADRVRTREGDEEGGWWLSTKDGAAGLRAWTVAAGTDLDAPHRRGRAYRFSPSRVAARVLLAQGERAGLLTDGVELRLVLCDPARPDAHVSFALDRGGWRGTREIPDSFRLLLALACPRGVAAVPELVEAARLSQATVTKKLRQQARQAVRGFVQGVLDEPSNQAWLLERRGAAQATAEALWHEGLVLVYRLLFVFKMESSADPARAFSFAATSLWRNSYSPNTALAPVVPGVLQGEETGGFLEGSLRTLFRLFSEGLSSAELKVSPLGGALFGKGATPTLDGLSWGERSVARLLDALLWTPGDGRSERERVHYGSLDVEDLGRVYEALLELEPGITTEPMCRLRRAKLEVVVPAVQGDPYRPIDAVDLEEGEIEADDEDDDVGSTKGKNKTKVTWVEDIPAGRFFLRTGLGRKSSGSYYTPHPFVRFLVQETLGPQIAERSPPADPQPRRLLDLKILDPAMGSGHFLVEACRYLGDALYEACRLCDELASTAEERGDAERAGELRHRVEELPDPNDELLAWLPSRAPEGTAAGLSQKRAEALCRRLVAVHCLYGVDKNLLAVELAKLSLWLESYAEGLPLTFLDHRLICGDSLTGPFVEHLLTWPKAGTPIGEDLLSLGLREKLEATLGEALARVRDLTASVGKDVADLEQKAGAKAALDRALEPFWRLAAAWSGGVMLGSETDDGVYLAALRAVAEGSSWPEGRALVRLELAGRHGVPYDLVFPEVFHPDGRIQRLGGFHAVLGNPPWDAIQFKSKEFLAGFDLAVLEAPTKNERETAEAKLLSQPAVAAELASATERFEQQKRANDRLYDFQKVTIEGDLAGRQLDSFRVFMERNAQLLVDKGAVGVVVPSAFHSNAGAAGIRDLYLRRMSLRSCFSFENRHKLFEIDSRFKFAVVVASSGSTGTKSFDCAFYLHDLGWLFSGEGRLNYTLKMVEVIGGDYLNLPELTTPEDARVFEQIAAGASQTMGAHLDEGSIQLRMTELHTTHDSARFIPLPTDSPEPRSHDGGRRLLAARRLVLMEGKGFHQFDGAWGERPRYCVDISSLADKESVLAPARHYRAAFRKIASSTNERTLIAAVLPPGTVFADSTISEMVPDARPHSLALVTCALANTYVFDWFMRKKVSANVNIFILRQGLLPPSQKVAAFLCHASLRLTCNHAGYAALWIEQLGDNWQEESIAHTWPVLANDDARWALRSAIDAVVTDAYGLSREQYDHVLSGFSHKSYPGAPSLCLRAYDELKAIGLTAFLEKHDPYHAVPVVRTLPKPVLDFGAERSDPVREATMAVKDSLPTWASVSATDRSVRLLVMLLDAARSKDRLNDMGAVKAEKFLHVAGEHLGIDLERKPVRLVAGPIDKPRQEKIFARARKQNIFDTRLVLGRRDFVIRHGFDRALARARETFADDVDAVTGLAELFAGLDTDGAEILATLYAAWNDLLHDGLPADDTSILQAFYDWHPEKAKHQRDRVSRALAFLREQALVPSGRARPTPPPGA